MAWNDNLQGIWLNIAADPSRLVHVLAGPGTGKTFSLMRRIARLLEEGQEPESILSVTFTRTAAKDLTEQLGQLGDRRGNRGSGDNFARFVLLDSESRGGVSVQ